ARRPRRPGEGRGIRDRRPGRRDPRRRGSPSPGRAGRLHRGCGRARCGDARAGVGSRDVRFAPLGRAGPRSRPRSSRARALPRSRPASGRRNGRGALRAPRSRRRARLHRHGDVQVRRRGWSRMTRIIVIAGTASGVGKTSITLGLIAALRRRGLVVQAFKVGPDFIDAGLHEVASGRVSYNLDGWMCGHEVVLDTVARHAADADVAIVEGVMGCFDGLDATSDAGSTSQIAKWLDAPVVLVVDAGAQARSAAATVLGFERFDPALNLAAVIVNRVGGEMHARWVTEAVHVACRAMPVGAIPRDDHAWTMPERHLGLITAAEGLLDRARLDGMADVVERGVDIEQLLALAANRSLQTTPAV